MNWSIVTLLEPITGHHHSRPFSFHRTVLCQQIQTVSILLFGIDQDTHAILHSLPDNTSSNLMFDLFGDSGASQNGQPNSLIWKQCNYIPFIRRSLWTNRPTECDIFSIWTWLYLKLLRQKRLYTLFGSLLYTQDIYPLLYTAYYSILVLSQPFHLLFQFKQTLYTWALEHDQRLSECHQANKM